MSIIADYESVKLELQRQGYEAQLANAQRTALEYPDHPEYHKLVQHFKGQIWAIDKRMAVLNPKLIIQRRLF